MRSAGLPGRQCALSAAADAYQARYLMRAPDCQFTDDPDARSINLLVDHPGSSRVNSREVSTRCSTPKGTRIEPPLLTIQAVSSALPFENS